jgi:hypothetical protein
VRLLPLRYSLQALQPHQPRHSPSAAYDPERPKLCVHSGVSEGLAAPAMDLADLLGEQSVLSRLLSEGGLLRQA